MHQKNARQQEKERAWKQLQQQRAREQQMQQQIQHPVAQEKMHGKWTLRVYLHLTHIKFG